LSHIQSSISTILIQTDRTLLLAGVRIVLALLLVAVQLYVARAMIRVIRSIMLERDKEKRIIIAVQVLLCVLNIPLIFLFVESVIRPGSLLLYAPPLEYEAVVRPFSYLFFVWTIGSLLFSAASPIVMAGFAVVQFFRRKKNDAGDDESSVEVFDLSRRRFLQMALTAVASMPFAVSAYGAVAARARKVVERVFVPIPDLPAQLDGLPSSN